MRLGITRRGAILIMALAALAGRSGADDPPKKLCALIIDGQSQGDHDGDSTTRELRAALEKSGRFKVEVVSIPPLPAPLPKEPPRGAPQEMVNLYGKLKTSRERLVTMHRKIMEGFRPDLDQIDVLIDNYDGDPWPETFRRSVVEHARDGKVGLVVVHAANHSFADWPEFNRMIGLGCRSDPKAGPALKVADDGKITMVPAGQGKGATEDLKRPTTIAVRDPEHPITRGMPARWRHAPDEVFHTLRGPAEGLHLLASYRAEGASGDHEPAAWTVDYGRGRVFVTPLGHDAEGQRCPGFASLFCRGAEWAATGRVTLDLPEDFPKATGGPEPRR